jgi:prolyl-tRNA editing enzyme YbaK/EbsC (Cys-tRNA(Pro) deacylase)
MLSPGEVEETLGLAVGGVCPFAVDAPVYLDVSLKRFDTVYPAAGDDHSAVRLTPEELASACTSAEWIDVCKGWSEV